MFNKNFLKIFGKVKTFPDTIQPIMWLCRLMGLTVIEYPIGRPWWKLSVVNSLIRSLLYGCLIYYGEKYISQKGSININTMLVVYNVIKFINVCVVTIMIALNILAYKGKSEYLKKIIMVDAILEEFSIDPEYSIEQRRNLYICFIWAGIAFTIHTSAFVSASYIYNYFTEAFIRSFLYCTPLSLNLLVQIKIGELVSIMARRFERLNALTHNIVQSTRGNEVSKNVNKYHRILQRNCPKKASEDSFLKYKENIVVLLKTVRQLHLYLCTTTRAMMKTYGSEILLHLSSNFLLVTGFSYISYLVYNEPSMKKATKIAQLNLLWTGIIISLLVTVFLIYSTSSVMEEAKKTSHVAYEIQSVDQEVLNEMHQLSLQVMQHPLYLTASDFYVLDFVYIRGFIGSVTTYFMILIQNRSFN